MSISVYQSRYFNGYVKLVETFLFEFLQQFFEKLRLLPLRTGYLCFVSDSDILCCLFLVAMWSPAGKGLTSWLDMVFLVFCHFVMWYPGSGVVHINSIVHIDS